MQKSGIRGIQSVEIGYRVLLAVQGGPGPVTLKEIAARAELTPSAAHNYLASLIRTGLVWSDRRGSYRLGPSAAALGLAALKQTDTFDVIRTEAVILQEETGHDATVACWSEAGPVIIFRKEDAQRGGFSLRIGQVHLLTTGAGNVFVAYLDSKTVRPIAIAELAANSQPRGRCDSLLAKIRSDVTAKGYAALPSITVPGYGSLSAPVWDHNDAVLYALTVTGPASDLDFRPDGVHVPHLLRCAQRASRQLGAPAERWTQTRRA
jgi:DNA-binding IclR family transcriptional regulator